GPKLSAGWFVVEQDRKRLTGLIEQAIIKCPDRCLRTIAGTDFSQDRLDMRLHGRLRDPEEPRDLLVGISAHDAFKKCDLPGRELHGLGLIAHVPQHLAAE